jgi:predicted lipoprotein with Yx(FWY)xxD motif
MKLFALALALLVSSTAFAAEPLKKVDGAYAAYKGKPLYFYQADQKAGDRSGDNFKDVWHLVKE